MAVQPQTKFNVGGVELDRPFKVRRLGHFGINSDHMAESLEFYTKLLGFRVSDFVDFERMIGAERAAGLGPAKGYFMRHGPEHHSFVVFPRPVYEQVVQGRGGRIPAGVTINQVTWQVGSMQEVHEGIEWFHSTGRPIVRTGRDMPGSNWHMYMPDLDGHVNELYYGIEIVGWDGYSKPLPMRDRVFHETPSVPQIPEYQEVDQALAKDVDLLAGNRWQEPLPATYDVEGILLPRPYKIVRVGPVGLYVRDVAAAERFYVDVLGLSVTERVLWQGHECLFLRANTEHHSLALYPVALREQLGTRSDTSLAWFGLQLANYRQLRASVDFLRSHGCTVDELPPELHPGIDYAATVRDPDGHLLQLYAGMEQIGWDGRPRPASSRPRAGLAQWPDVLPAHSDAYGGEAFLGPWG